MKKYDYALFPRCSVRFPDTRLVRVYSKPLMARGTPWGSLGPPRIRNGQTCTQHTVMGSKWSDHA